MHDDERRDPDRLERALLATATADPEQLYHRLRTADADQRLWRRRAESLQRDVERLSQQTARLREEQERLAQRARKHGSTYAALEAYRAENKRLKQDLARLRSSRSMRIGRAVLAPAAHLRRRPPAAPEPAAPAPAASASATRQQIPAPGQGTSPAPRDRTGAPAPRRLSEMSLEELLERFEAERTPQRLAACVNRLWYQHGAIDRTLALLGEHPDLIAGMSAKERQLVERVRGTAALRGGAGRLLPPRAAGAAYVPERGRVLYCAYSTPVYHSNGYSVRTRGVVAGLRAAGVDIAVAARSGYPWDIATDTPKPRRRRWVETRDGVEYTHLPEGSLGHDAPDDYVLVAADAYVREARLRRPSLLHAASNHVNGLAGLIAARRLGVPFVYEVRGLWEVTEASAKEGWEDTDRYAAQSELEILVCREADAVLAITEEVGHELVRRGVDAATIHLAPNGVDPRAVQPLPLDRTHRQELGLRDDVPVIGFAGSLVDYEGLDVLLAAARVLRGRGVGFQVAIAGQGGVQDRLTAFVREHALEPHVRFLGRRPAEEMPRVLSCFDLVCCPRKSLPVTEMVSPLKPLEAFAAAKPVVLSDVSPHRVIVGEHGERGLLAAPDDPVALADALQALIEDSERRAAMGRAGRLWVADERSWSTLGEQVRRVYAGVLPGREDAPGRALADLRIGLIADEFTTETLRSSATVVPLDGERFEEQLRGQRLDLVFLESAWNGNGGQWHRAVGHYSAEEDARIARLLDVCRELGVPTVFWNKEDPVHFERFKATAARCDHVFTTDANMIRPYLRTAREVAGGRAVTVSSLPFHAQPAIHNPLPGALPVEDTVAYAGTFYGDRYAERSAQLSRMLHAARPHGLAIYDRQLAVPGSPYRFPAEFRRDVRGALPYDEVVDSYKAHTANLNVNSVADSPTMFSRRVVEIAACGGVVLSAWGRGVAETFGGLVPATNDEKSWAALLASWSTDPRERLAEAWLQLRTVYRSHTVDTALTVVARTAGIAVAGLRLPSYGLELDPADPAALGAAVAQSVAPSAVLLTGPDPHGAAARALATAGIPAVAAGEPRAAGIEWWGRARGGLARTWAEDLLTATRYGRWDHLLTRALRDGEDGRPFALPVTGPAAAGADDGLVRADSLAAHGGDLAAAAAAGPVDGLLLLTAEPAVGAPGHASGAGTSAGSDPGTVLVAGHDLKFAGAWVGHLRERGVTVLLDEWADHARHDEERSRELLAQADTVFCEWGLGNAVWYARHVRPGQRLVVRVHAQELRRPYLRRIEHAKVSAYVFVGELMRDAAVRSHGVPRDRTVVVPNYVLADDLDSPKEPGAEHVLGMVGMVPRSKRIDRAAELIERLLERDDRFRLRVRGRRPEDYAWMARREDEMAFYRAADERVHRINDRAGAEVVAFDGHGQDMPRWYRGIGTAISLSDLESFHLTLPDGAASGAAPVSLAWPGADLIYPREWLVATLPQMTDRIAALAADPGLREAFTARARAHTREAFDRAVVFDRLDGVLAGRVSPRSTAPELVIA